MEVIQIGHNLENAQQVVGLVFRYVIDIVPIQDLLTVVKIVNMVQSIPKQILAENHHVQVCLFFKEKALTIKTSKFSFQPLTNVRV